MSAYVGHRAEFSALLRQHAPVVVGGVEEPVLHVAAADRVDLTKLSLGHAVAGLEAERVVA